MANKHVLLDDGLLVGVYSDISIAQAVEALLRRTTGSARANTQIVTVVEDYPNTQLQAGEKPFLVTWLDIKVPAKYSVQESRLQRLGQEGDVSWNSATAKFTVTVWAVDERAAMMEAEPIRAAFVIANGL